MCSKLLFPSWNKTRGFDWKCFFFPVAKEKKEAAKLLSRTCVISSHQPVRVQSYNEEVHRKSEVASRRRSSGGQSWHSSEHLESMLHTDNFRELLHDPVEVQLQKLLGEDADSFLHPVFREGAKKTMIPLNARKCEWFVAWVVEALIAVMPVSYIKLILCMVTLLGRSNYTVAAAVE